MTKIKSPWPLHAALDCKHMNILRLLTHTCKSWTVFHVIWWFSWALGKQSPYIDHLLLFDLELWPATLTLTSLAMAKFNLHAKIKVKGHTVQTGEHSQASRQTDRWTDRCYKTYYLPAWRLINTRINLIRLMKKSTDFYFLPLGPMLFQAQLQLWDYRQPTIFLPSFVVNGAIECI